MGSSPLDWVAAVNCHHYVLQSAQPSVAYLKFFLGIFSRKYAYFAAGPSCNVQYTEKYAIRSKTRTFAFDVLFWLALGHFPSELLRKGSQETQSRQKVVPEPIIVKQPEARL
jgi:hypothetical protein